MGGIEAPRQVAGQHEPVLRVRVLVLAERPCGAGVSAAPPRPALPGSCLCTVVLTRGGGGGGGGGQEQQSKEQRHQVDFTNPFRPSPGKLPRRVDIIYELPRRAVGPYVGPYRLPWDVAMLRSSCGSSGLKKVAPTLSKQGRLGAISLPNCLPRGLPCLPDKLAYFVRERTQIHSVLKTCAVAVVEHNP
jgi:hypothetical protein